MIIHYQPSISRRVSPQISGPPARSQEAAGSAPPHHAADAWALAAPACAGAESGSHNPRPVG